jgi:hypothetical protein
MIAAVRLHILEERTVSYGAEFASLQKASSVQV